MWNALAREREREMLVVRLTGESVDTSTVALDQAPVASARECLAVYAESFQVTRSDESMLLN
jgi:hypothetical protein